MKILLADDDRYLDAIRRGRVALVARLAQLTHCRACGAEKTEMQRAIDTLRELEDQLREDEPCI